MMQYIIMSLLALFLLFPDELRGWELMLRGTHSIPQQVIHMLDIRHMVHRLVSRWLYMYAVLHYNL